MPLLHALCALLALSPTGAPPAQASPTFVYPGLTLPQTLSRFHDKFKKSVVCDAYAGGSGILEDSNWINLPADQAIRYIAAKFQRQLFVVGDVYVLRATKRAELLAPEQDESNPFQWTVAEKITIKIDPKKSVQETATRYDLPEQILDVSGEPVSCGKFASEMGKVAHWNVRVAPEIARRRMFIFADDVSTSTLIGSVALAMNAGPEVVLRPSESQLALEKDKSIGLPEDMRKRLKASDELRKDLEKLLTKDQKIALSNGEFVEINIDSLSPGLRARALEYIKLSASLMSEYVPEPDMAHANLFQVRFRPPQSGELSNELGAVLADSRGALHYF